MTVFLPCVLIGTWACARIRNGRVASNVFLFLASLVFALWGGPATLACLLGSIIVNHALVRAMSRAGSTKARKGWCSVAVAGNLLFLCVFKYAGLAANTVNSLAGTAFAPPAIVAVGISFYTFRAISYVVDVFRGTIEPARNLFELANALAFFPVFTAGPIARLGGTINELRERKTTLQSSAAGLRRFIVGLGKKAVVADTLATYANAVWGYAAAGSAMEPIYAWFGLVCYALQLYYDFSGYSDMAIGIARMLGFTIPENFDHPYAATSVRDFWRRWHISLSTWFRDYLYIPLGGNRLGLSRACLNSLVVFALCGLWHGANWMFLAWGLWHGLFITIERLALARRPRGSRFLPSVPGHIYATFAFLLGWLIFRSANLSELRVMLASLFALGAPDATTRMLLIDATPRVIVTAVVAVAFAFPVPAAPQAFLRRLADAHPASIPAARFARDISISAIGIAALIAMAGGSYHAFLYAKF